MAKPNVENMTPSERQRIYDELDDLGKSIAKEFELEPDQIEVNTAPTGSTWMLELYIKDEEELRKLLTFMRANDMIVGFE